MLSSRRPGFRGCFAFGHIAPQGRKGRSRATDYILDRFSLLRTRNRSSFTPSRQVSLRTMPATGLVLILNLRSPRQRSRQMASMASIEASIALSTGARATGGCASSTGDDRRRRQVKSFVYACMYSSHSLTPIRTSIHYRSVSRVMKAIDTLMCCPLPPEDSSRRQRPE
jgi:hypothetical protein